MLKKLVKKLSGTKESDKARQRCIATGMLLGADRQEMDTSATPPVLKKIVESFEPSANLNLVDGKVPLVWWVNTENFGDLLSPWLIGRMTGKEIVFGGNIDNSYVCIGSILRYVNPNSVVWGTGSFGPEPQSQVKTTPKYRCVRGPLTRSKIVDFGGDCPRIYGDPALALPLYYWPEVEKKYDYGLVIRWSESKWHQLQAPPNVKIISLGTTDIRQTIKDILSCRNIATSSLHGVILADAYSIPNAWLLAEEGFAGSRPKGGEFKYYDYFASVDKMRKSQILKVESNIPMLDRLSYDGRPIVFDYEEYLQSCPFLQKKRQ